jgi:hypothetical protein
MIKDFPILLLVRMFNHAGQIGAYGCGFRTENSEPDPSRGDNPATAPGLSEVLSDRRKAHSLRLPGLCSDANLLANDKAMIEIVLSVGEH